MPEHGKSYDFAPSSAEFGTTGHFQAQETASATPFFALPHYSGQEYPSTRHAEQTPVHDSTQQTIRSESQQPQDRADARSMHRLVVRSFEPTEGVQNTIVRARFFSIYTLAATSSPYSLSLLFGFQRVPCTVQPIQSQGNANEYILTATIPDFAATGWNETRGNVNILVEDHAGSFTDSFEAGIFSYASSNQYFASEASSHLSRKRKISAGSESPQQPSKRQPRNSLVESSKEAHKLSFGRRQSHYSSASQDSVEPRSYGSPKTVEVPEAAMHLRQSSVPHQTPFNPNDPAQFKLLDTQSPQTPMWNPAYHAADSQLVPYSNGLAETYPTIESRRHTVVSEGSTNPPLIRTSTIQQSPPIGGGNNYTQFSQGFNPYAMYPTKAVLKIHGDLDGVARNWTPEDVASRRRIVRFQRSQTGSTIDARFETLPQDERPPNGICISCILWEEKGECYVTSVDTIYLLESLVAVRFTVEEKNRIRRNLEGFKPLTVSKARSDSEEFFKVIMGFGNPKPRNIEKDVKVFPWKILAHALKKIIGKYSASYSSTAGVMLTPLSGGPNSSGGPATSAPEFSESVFGYGNQVPSPCSMSEHVPTTTASALGITSMGLSPHVPAATESFDAAKGQPELHVMTGAWFAGEENEHEDLQAPYQRPHTGPNPWGPLATYHFENSPASTTLSSASIDSQAFAFSHPHHQLRSHPESATSHLSHPHQHHGMMQSPYNSTPRSARPISRA